MLWRVSLVAATPTPMRMEEAGPRPDAPVPEDGSDSHPLRESRSLLGAAASFAASMARFAASGFKTVDEPLHQLRMSRCEPCEYREDNQCLLCRCFVAQKAWLPHEDCPIGRWPT